MAKGVCWVVSLIVVALREREKVREGEKVWGGGEKVRRGRR